MSMSPYVKRVRSSIGSDPLLMPSVAGLIHDTGGRLLLVRDAVSGTWGLPAGAIEPGEEPRQAVAREVLEETGYRVHVGPLIDVLGGSAFRCIYENGDLTEYVVAVFRCELTERVGVPDEGEVAEARFFHRADAPALAMPFSPRLLWGPWARPGDA